MFTFYLYIQYEMKHIMGDENRVLRLRKKTINHIENNLYSKYELI